MAYEKDDWTNKVVPLEPHRRRTRALNTPAPVAALPGSEAAVPWQGDEQWVSTLPAPHDATIQDESE